MSAHHKPVLCQQKRQVLHPRRFESSIPSWWEITAERITHSLRDGHQPNTKPDNTAQKVAEHIEECWAEHENAMRRSSNQRKLHPQHLFGKRVFSQQKLHKQLKSIVENMLTRQRSDMSHHQALSECLIVLGQQLAVYQALDFAYGLNTKWN
ncbi:MAG: hypothetical protein AAGK03_03770 [Pseudomonadota bacterium]